MSENNVKENLPKMNPEVKTLWVEALRSGKFEQGDSQLMTNKQWSEDAQEEVPLDVPKYCCLGVLCTLPGSPEAPSNAEMPKPETTAWADLTYNKILGSSLSWEGPAKILADLNDDGQSFEYIANFIEENL